MSTLQSSARGTSVDLSKIQSFIPELWSEQVRRFRDQKLYASQVTETMPIQGQKGDTFWVNNISRLAIYDKLPQTPVQLQARTESSVPIRVTRYKESSVMIEDIVAVQNSLQGRLMAEYTREAGYALARDIDNFVLAHRAVINAFPTQRVYSYNNGTTDVVGDGTINAHLTGTPAPLNYASLLFAMQRLAEADVDQEELMLWVSPAQHYDLLNINQFTSIDYSDVKNIARGQVGKLFGHIPVCMTSLIGANSLTGYVNGTGGALQPTPGVLGSPYLPDQVTGTNIVATGSASDLSQTDMPFYALPVRSGAGATAADGGQTLGLTTAANQWASALLCSKRWMKTIVQQDPKVESSRETMYLADACVTSDIYGGRVMRPDHAVVIHTSAI